MDGRPIVPADCTVTVAVPLEIFAVDVLAVTVVEPVAAPVTAIVAVVAPCAIVTEAGIVAMPVGFALRFTVMPPVGAAVESVTVRFLVSVPVSVNGEGVRVSEAVACTLCVAEP